MSLLVDVQLVPNKILEVVKARILANRARLLAEQETAQVRGATRPRVQRPRFGATATTYRRPEPAAVGGGYEVAGFYESNDPDGDRIWSLDGTASVLYNPITAASSPVPEAESEGNEYEGVSSSTYTASTLSNTSDSLRVHFPVSRYVSLVAWVESSSGASIEWPVTSTTTWRNEEFTFTPQFGPTQGIPETRWRLVVDTETTSGEPYFAGSQSSYSFKCVLVGRNFAQELTPPPAFVEALSRFIVDGASTTYSPQISGRQQLAEQMLQVFDTNYDGDPSAKVPFRFPYNYGNLFPTPPDDFTGTSWAYFTHLNGMGGGLTGSGRRSMLFNANTPGADDVRGYQTAFNERVRSIGMGDFQFETPASYLILLNPELEDQYDFRTQLLTGAEIGAEFFQELAPKVTLLRVGKSVDTDQFNYINGLFHKYEIDYDDARQRSKSNPVAKFKHDLFDVNGVPGSLYGTWDWGRPQYCLQQLLALGFTPEDLSPTTPDPE